jgi:hypothetical protein
MNEAAFRKCEKAKGRSIPFAKTDNTIEECLWISGIKMILYKGQVICKDQDYADLSPKGRAITSERYLSQMQEAIMSSDISDIAEPNFFKKRIKGVCRFGDMLHEKLTEEDKQTVLIDLKHKSPKEVALIWNLSEWYCKSLFYNQKKH